jgi:hypothetical protein
LRSSGACSPTKVGSARSSDRRLALAARTTDALGPFFNGLLGAYDVPVFGLKAHVAIPLPSGRITYTPRLEVIALTGQGWRQVTPTFGLGMDW